MEQEVSVPWHPRLLALSDGVPELAVTAPWIGAFVDLGIRASQFADTLDGRQLVIGISVPCRDYVAALAGCGWILAADAPESSEPIDVLRRLKHRDPVRLVTERDVLTDYFYKLDETAAQPIAQIGGSKWHISKIKAIAALGGLDSPERLAYRTPADLGSEQINDSWHARLASSAADLAIIGTTSWLQEDMKASIALDSILPVPPKSGPAVHAPARTMADILMAASFGVQPAACLARLCSSVTAASQIPLPDEIRAVILDGFGAIKHLAQFETPVVICVVDRSVADESASEIIIQQRNSGSRPLSLRDDLGWLVPGGVEALAFTVRL